MANYTRITLMNGNTYTLTKLEADYVAKAKNAGKGVVSLTRLGVMVVPNQIIDFTDTNHGDGATAAIEAGAYKRPEGHRQIVNLDTCQVLCTCGRQVFSALVARQIEKKEWTKLSGTPGYHYIYEEDGMIWIATTRFLCSLEQMPEGMRHCSEAEYNRFRPLTSWLQRSAI